MKFKITTHSVGMLAVLVLAAMIRLYGLSSYPASLYWEEVALGYDAYSISETGRDLHGEFLPLVAFRSFGDYKPSGYFYALVPFVKIFGLEPWVVRAPSALAGIIMVFLSYKISNILFKKKELGLWTSLSLALLPWHIHFSRAAFEVNLATTFMFAMVYFLLKESSKRSFFTALIFGILSAYTYHGMRIVAPILFVMVLFYMKKPFKTYLLGTLLFVVGFIPLILNLTQPSVSQRFSETSMFSVSQAVVDTNRLRAEDGNTLLARLWHHRYWYWVREIVTHSLSHFDLSFYLFGDGNPRHQTDSTGLVYWWMIPIALYGLIRLPRSSMVILLLMAGLFSLPAALTKTTPHSLRFLPASVVFALFSGSGMYWLTKRSKLLTVGILFGLLASYGAYAYDYMVTSPIKHSSAWQYGYDELVEYIQQFPSTHTIYISRDMGRPSAYFWFFGKIDPRNVQSQSLKVKKDQGEFLEFDHLVFADPALSEIQAGEVFVSTQPLDSGELLNTITNLQNHPVFYVYQF